MNSISSLSVLRLVFLGSLCIAASEPLAAQDATPNEGDGHLKNTIVFVQIRDTSWVLRQALQSSLGIAIQESPFGQLLREFAETATEHELPYSDAIMMDGEFSLDSLVERWAGDGDSNFHVYGEIGDLNILAAISLRYDIDFLGKLFDIAVDENVLESIGAEFVDDEKLVLASADNRLFARWTGTHLVMGTELGVVSNWESSVRQNELNGPESNRKFLTAKSILDLRNSDDKCAVMFIDLYAILANYARAAEADEVEAAFRTIGFDRMLALTTIIDLPENSDIDFDAKLFVQMAIPKEGFSLILRDAPLSESVFEEMPGEIDFCVAASLELVQLFGLLERIDEVVELPISGPPSYRKPSRYLSHVFPALGYAASWPEADRELLSGEVLAFGRAIDFADTTRIVSATSVGAAEGGTEQIASTIMSQYGSQLGLGMERTDLRDGSIAIRVSDSELETRQRLALEASERDGTPFIQPFRTIFTNYRRSFRIYKDGELLNLQEDTHHNSVVESESFQVAWDDLGASEPRPVAFGLSSSRASFSWLYDYLNRSTWKAAIAATYPTSKAAREGSEFEMAFSRRAATQHEMWSYSGFMNRIGYIAFGLYGHEKGVKSRILLYNSSLREQ